MPHPNFILLYVDSPVASTAFYEGILGKKAVEASPTFSMFELGTDLMLGLWSKHTVEPKPEAPGASTELAIAVEEAATVDQMHADWKKRGLRIAQVPTKMDFGRTFVALDPDGHRLRVFAP